MTTVTKELISALRKADNISLYYNDGKGMIALSREDKQTKDGGTISYPRFEAETDTSIEIYRTPENPEGYGGYNYEAKAISAHEFVSLHYGSGAAIRHYLKEGDDIKVKWIANGGNGYGWNLECNHPNYKGERLYLDSCRLVIIPKGHDYSYRAPEIIIASGLCPNNSARMIKYY